MLNDMLQLMQNPAEYRRKTTVNELLVHARHPVNLPSIVESLSSGDPLISSALIEASLDPKLPPVLRCNMFEIVRQLGFPLSRHSVGKLKRKMGKFCEAEKAKANEMLVGLRTGPSGPTNAATD